MNERQTASMISSGENRRNKTLLLISVGTLAAMAVCGALFTFFANFSSSRAERLTRKDPQLAMNTHGVRQASVGGIGVPGLSRQSRDGRPGERPGGRPDGGPDGGPGAGNRPGGGEQRGQMMAHMSEQFGLNEAQQTQMKAIQEAAMPQMRALREDTSLSQEDRRTKFQQMRQQMQAQMRQLMTPDQQAKFDQWQAQRQQRRQEMQQRHQQTIANLQANGQKVPDFGGRGHGGFGRDGGR